MQLAVKLLLFISLLVCCSYAGDRIILDDFKDPHRCVFAALVTPSNSDCSGSVGGTACVVTANNCASAKVTSGAVGGQRETFISLLAGFPTQLGGDCGSTVFDLTSATVKDYRWTTYFGNGNGGFAELTLDGAGSDPTKVENTFMTVDVTAQDSIGFHFLIYTQFDTEMQFIVIDNDGSTANTPDNFWILFGLANNIKYLHYLVPFNDLVATNVTTVDLTKVGALDIGLYEPDADDTTLKLFSTYAHAIQGLVWGDCNNLCVFDAVQERGIAGATVQLNKQSTCSSLPYTVCIDTTLTDASGNFNFAVDAGTYEVCVVTPSGATPLNSCTFTDSVPEPFNGCVTITVGTAGRDYRTPYPLDSDPFADEPKGSLALRFPYTFSVSVIVPPSVTIQCGVSTIPSGSTTVGTATGSSACGGSPSITFSDFIAPGCGGTSVITRTWTATANSISDSDIQVITIIDTVDPVFVSATFPANAPALTCGSCTTPSATCLGTASATDSCSTVFIDFVDVPRAGADSCLTIVDRTWTATDSCLNDVDRTQVFTIQDNAAPQFNFFPNTVTVNCNANIDPNLTGGFPTLAADCNPTSLSWTDVTTGSGCTTTVSRTWRAVDTCLNVNTRVQIINKTDLQPPLITAPPDVTVNCDTVDGLNPSNTGTPLTFDDCSSTLPTYRDTATIPCEVITRTWSISDGCNPTVSDIQLINYSDPSPPDFVNFPSDFTTSCSSSSSTSPSQAGQPTARDTCSGVSGITFRDSSPTGSCTISITRTWQATNGCGSSNFQDQRLFVTDNTPPSMTIPRDLELDCEDSREPSNTGFPTVTDLCSNTLPVGRDDDVEGNTCVTTIRRTWTVSDVCDNDAPAQTQIIVLRDDTAPDFTNFPVDITVGCLASTSTAALGQPGFTDDCSFFTTTLTFSDRPSAANCPQLSQIIRTWTVSDGCGNTNVRTQTIGILDDQDPILVAPADISISCEGDRSPSITGFPTVQTICGEDFDAPSFIDVTSTTTCPTIVTRTWSVQDFCGDSDSDTQIITLTDNIGPQFFNTPEDIVVSCAEDIPGIADDSDFVVTDNCDPDPNVSFSDLTQDLPGVGICPGDTIITRTFRASDNCGNSNFFTQTITVINVPPAECSPVDCTPSPCDRSSCPNQDCDCCGADPVPCQAVNCSPTNCNPVPCTAIPCSGCDVVPVSNGCQPVLCAPTYIDIDDDDVLASDRGGLKQVVVDNPKVSGSAQLVVSTLLLVAAFASVFVALF